MNYQDNRIITRLISAGFMSADPFKIDTSFELSEEIRAALAAKKMKAEYHFDAVSGALVFDKLLGRDESGDFYNEENGNKAQRQEEIKIVIVGVLVSKYNSIAGAE